MKTFLIGLASVFAMAGPVSATTQYNQGHADGISEGMLILHCVNMVHDVYRDREEAAEYMRVAWNDWPLRADQKQGLIDLWKEYNDRPCLDALGY